MPPFAPQQEAVAAAGTEGGVWAVASTAAAAVEGFRRFGQRGVALLATGGCDSCHGPAGVTPNLGAVPTHPVGRNTLAPLEPSEKPDTSNYDESYGGPGHDEHREVERAVGRCRQDKAYNNEPPPFVS